MYGATVWSWYPSVGNTYANGVVAVSQSLTWVNVVDYNDGSIDWYDLRGYGAGYTMWISLWPGTWSWFGPVTAGGDWATVFTDASTVIENAVGSGSNDAMIGHNLGNFLWGWYGNDTLWGLGGDDYLNGGVGADQLVGGFGGDVLDGEGDNDILWGEDGNDTLIGGQGQDVLYGGAGYDSFVFGFAASDVDAPDFVIGFDNPGDAAGDVFDLREAFNGGSFHLFIGVADRISIHGDGVHVFDVAGSSYTAIYVNNFWLFNEAWEPDLLIYVDDGAWTAAHYTAADFLL
jgi:Ca2+-binding RTX toxin-like protein